MPRSSVKYTNALDAKTLEACAAVSLGLPHGKSEERTMSASSTATENVSHGTAECMD
jgi:hypothetical protein